MKFIFTLLLSFGMISCGSQKNQEIPESEVIAVVGEAVITADLLKAFLNANGINQASDEMLSKGLDQLINEIAMANIAKKKKIQLDADQLNSLKYLNLKSLAIAAQKDYLLDNEITEDEIKKEYNNTNNQTGGIEFHVHHLLYKDEVQAIKALETIKSVEDYISAEKVYLIQFSNIKNVGNLGWVTLGQLPKEFQDSIPTQKENSVIPRVINSKYGAHIIYLEGIRKLQPPDFESVKSGIIKSLRNKRLSKFRQLAKAKAHVIIKQ